LNFGSKIQLNAHNYLQCLCNWILPKKTISFFLKAHLIIMTFFWKAHLKMGISRKTLRAKYERASFVMRQSFCWLWCSNMRLWERSVEWSFSKKMTCSKSYIAITTFYAFVHFWICKFYFSDRQQYWLLCKSKL